ncbi:MAG: hypothetical protein H0U74_10690 [Bradymonadaceae bacterium]|nr:hypothetical protein [Lujinxingiaceae bacterium]
MAWRVGVVAALLTTLVAGHAWALECTPVATIGGVRCEVDDVEDERFGQAVWSLVHASLYDDEQAFAAGKIGAAPVGPVVLAGRTFYAVHAGLLEIDPSAGQIVGRVRFPATISALNVVEGDASSLMVTLRHENYSLPDADRELVVRHHLDARGPGQLRWGGRPAETFSVWRDASFRAQTPDSKALAEDYLQMLAELERADTTNPFFAFLAGEQYQRAQLEEEAFAAFERAANTPRASFSDLYMLSVKLEGAGARAAAHVAFERGFAAMEADGIRPERLLSLIAYAVTFFGIREVIEQAVERGDVAHVDLLVSRVQRVFPFVEGGPHAWRALADWMQEQGRADLAQKWRAHAAQAESGAFFEMSTKAAQVDRFLNAIAGLSLALILIALIVGMRGGVARRRLREAQPEAGGRWWMPVLKLREVLAPILVLAILTPLPFLASTHVAAIGVIAAMPTGVFEDGLASPEVELWLDKLTASEARDALATIAHNEREALVSGVALADKPPINALLIDAINAHSYSHRLDRFTSGSYVSLFSQVALDDTSVVSALDTNPLYALTGLFHVALLILLGGLIGNFLPRVAGVVQLALPGAPAIFAPLGGLILAAFLSAALALLGFDFILQNIATPGFARYFGLEAIANAPLDHDRTWAYATIVATLLIHAAGVLVERRR